MAKTRGGRALHVIRGGWRIHGIRGCRIRGCRIRRGHAGVHDVQRGPNGHGDQQQKAKKIRKTPEQLKALDRFVSVVTYPTREMKEALALELGLTVRQVTYWFSHRRHKEKKLRLAEEMRLIEGVGSEAGPSTPNITAEASPDISPPPTSRLHTNHGGNQPNRGPIYGMNFDPLPPGAFGTPIVIEEPYQPRQSSNLITLGRSSSTEHYFLPSSNVNRELIGVPVVNHHVGSRVLHEYQFFPNLPNFIERNDSTHAPGMGQLPPSSSQEVPTNAPSAQFGSQSAVGQDGTSELSN